MTKEMDSKHCVGCEDDFYNGKNELGVQKCWSLKSAKLMTRYRIGTWTQPTENGAFTQMQRPGCYRQKGCAFYNKLPDFAIGVRKSA